MRDILWIACNHWHFQVASLEWHSCYSYAIQLTFCFRTWQCAVSLCIFFFRFEAKLKKLKYWTTEYLWFHFNVVLFCSNLWVRKSDNVDHWHRSLRYKHRDFWNHWVILPTLCYFSHLSNFSHLESTCIENGGLERYV